jgi:putative ABC transport system permease protein
MIRNYCKVIFQNVIRNKTYSFINILGLSVGLAVFIIILQYVRFEQSYDRFHTQADQLYRIILEYTTSSGINDRDAANFAPVADALMNDYPEVTGSVRISPEYSKVVFNHDGTIAEEPKVYYADSTFFTLFDFKLLHGDPKTALTEVSSIVLSQTAAEKYFGRMNEWTESPLNKTILMNNKEALKVTGIMHDIPVNSHFKANALISFTTFIKFNDPSKEWGWNDFYTYIRLAPGTDYKALEARLPEFVKKYKGESKDKMILQPLTDIHLHSNVGFELNPNGSAQVVNFLSIISMMILIIAWVNYVNLATARAGHRAKEIGVRKANGATRRELIIQFLLESFCMNFVGLLVAFGIVSAVMPIVSQLLEKPLDLSVLNDAKFILYTFLIYVVGSLASGLYPAIVLSSFNPIKIFKPSSFFVAKGNGGLRQGLVVFQFMISAALITGTLIIENQMEFIRNRDLGFTFDKTLVMSASSTQHNDSLFFQDYQTLKEKLLRYPTIEAVTTSSVLPGKSHNDIDMHGGLRMQGDSEEVNYTASTFRVDENFIEVFKMKLIAGENFSDKYVSGEEKLIVN